MKKKAVSAILTAAMVLTSLFTVYASEGDPSQAVPAEEPAAVEDLAAEEVPAETAALPEEEFLPEETAVSAEDAEGTDFAQEHSFSPELGWDAPGSDPLAERAPGETAFQPQAAGFSLCNKLGIYDGTYYQYIGHGKKMKYEIASPAGSLIKGASKSALYRILPGSVGFTVNNKGALKADKSSVAIAKDLSYRVRGKAEMSVQFNGEEISVGAESIPATKWIGYIHKNKLKSSATVHGWVGETYNMLNLNSMVGYNVRAYYGKLTRKSHSTIYNTYYYAGRSNSTLMSWLPGITTTKKSYKNGIVEDGDFYYEGAVTKFTPMKAGTYVFTYTMKDGSGKKFRLKMKVI